jgi:flagellin-like hook-associated protein FlgL
MEKILADISAVGDRLKTLKVLRDRLAAVIDDTDSARDIAALSKQLTEVLEQIDTIENSKPGDEVTILESVLIKHKASTAAIGRQVSAKAPTKTKTKVSKTTKGKSGAKSKVGT